MAHVLRLTDGTVTVTFDTSPIKLMEYNPQVSADGSPIQETVILDFYSSTQATNVSNIQAVNRLLEQAVNYNQTETGPRVYVEFDPGTTGTVYRSMIRTGSIRLQENVLRNAYFNNKNILAIIDWQRDPFWEGPLTQIALSNSSATNNTSGITITNSYDPTAENFVDVDEAAVLGDIPCPIKIELEHTKSGADAAKEIYLAHNVYSNPSSFDHVLEAEDATGSTVTVSGADTTSSSDLYATLAWTATIETLIAEWALSTTLMTNAAGGRFAALARWRGVFPYEDAWIRLKLLTANNNALWSGNLSLISTNRELAILDVMRLPPYLVGQSAIKGIKLQMYGYRNQAGTHSIPLDYVQLSPISGNAGMKRFLSIDDGIAYQEKLIHDDIERFTYRVDTSSKLISELSDYNGPILLIPNKDQRIYINSCDKDGEAKVDQTWKVKLWHRPRRSSL